ncbi:MAG: hypothetical protein A2Y24_01010 [Clostridiales bacterium GWE2_32_10]|nr:MAG: hypothetical protein A2Y24_01010 [Clostridiales bacterium GWE2_32_10]HBY19794.1 hypothetical protein [Clostridiales bacterium]
MNCNACEYELGNKKICPNCGYDVEIYEKAKKISATFYNKGLNLLKNGCISQGVKLLEKSVDFDKTNIVARNLLGLGYMYIGKAGDALKQWMISIEFQKDNNLASEYIEELRKNKSAMSKYDESIAIYNEALAYIKERNEDVSIIKLKKALNLNENFIEAYKLLVLCYIIQKNYEKAMHFLDKAMKLDYNNAELINYYKILNPDSTITKQNAINEKQKIQKIYMKPRPNQAVNKKKLVTSMSILFGVIFLAGLLASMLFGAISSNDLNRVKEENKEYIAKLTEYETKINQLNKDLKTATERLGALKDEQSSTDQVKFLNQANELFANGSIEQAAIKIKQITKSDLDENQKLKYDNIYKNTIPVISQKYYTKARESLDAEKVSDAIINFEKSLYYSTQEVFSDDALYYSGLAYEKKGDKKKALENMKVIIKDYKDSDKLEKATAKKAELEK